MKYIVNEHDLDCNHFIGRTFPRQTGLNVSSKEAKITWRGEEMPLHPRNHFNDKQVFEKALANELHSTAEACANIVHDNTATKCANTNLNQLASQQDQSTVEHKAMLLKTLQKHKQLFEGLEHKQLGIFPN